MQLVCIVCPMGCNITAELQAGKPVITGNTCERGRVYAQTELTCPMRVLTSSVPVDGGNYALLSVKTAKAIPKAKMQQALAEVCALRAKAPVAVGDVLLRDVAATGVDLVATRSVQAK